MSLDDFEARVALPYFHGPHFEFADGGKPQNLDDAVAQAWGPPVDDAVDWRERLAAQLRDGSFHYIAVAQRFTAPVLRTLQYLNATCSGSRFSAVELVRFEGAGYAAFEARFVAGAEPRGRSNGRQQRSLAGVDEFLESVTDDRYRHALQDMFAAFADVPGLTIFWGTTGCSLRVPLPGRAPVSVGWLFPPGPSRWMGLSDVTFGWYEDANGFAARGHARQQLVNYRDALMALPGATLPKPSVISGATFSPEAAIASAPLLVETVRSVALGLAESWLT
jgi:hypothetical protein